MLKRDTITSVAATDAAAFRRLCVETHQIKTTNPPKGTAAFRRLCVETFVRYYSICYWTAAFRRLCVETLDV